METNELLQQILAKLGNLETGQQELRADVNMLKVGQQKLEDGQQKLEDGQHEMRSELTAMNQRLDSLEAGQQRLEKNALENAKDTGTFFNMQTEYLTAEFKKEITRIEIRIEHELFDKIEMLHEGYQMLREHLQIA